MKIYTASDHAGFNLKNQITEFLEGKGYEVEDQGPFEYDSQDDYPDYAKKACEKIKEGDKGILVCGTGQGMARVANKYKDIHASTCWDEFTTKVSAEHANDNVLCLGERTIETEIAKSLVEKWLDKREIGEKHQRRINKIKEVEEKNFYP